MRAYAPEDAAVLLNKHDLHPTQGCATLCCASYVLNSTSASLSSVAIAHARYARDSVVGTSGLET